MNTAGTTDDALELAKQRWAQVNRFDLEDSAWLDLFQQFGAPAVLEAIKSMKLCHTSNADTRYAWLLGRCARIAQSATRTEY